MNDPEKFKLMRSALDMSQREIAKEIGTSQAIISKIEKGITPVSRKILEKLQDKYGLNLDWFHNTRGSMFGKPETDIQTIAGDDRDEIIRLLKDQNFQLKKQVEDKETIIRFLREGKK